MNILRLVYEWPPPWDGLAPGPYELTEAQQKLGHDVVVFCGGGFKNLGPTKKPHNIFNLEGSKIKSPSNQEFENSTFKVELDIEVDYGCLDVFRFPRVLRKLSLFLTTAPSVLLGYLWLKLTGRGPDMSAPLPQKN